MCSRLSILTAFLNFWKTASEECSSNELVMLKKGYNRGRTRALMYALTLTTTLMLGNSATAQNPIVAENALPGSPKSEWDISGAGDMSIQGFATDMSVNMGSTIRFKIDVDGGVNYSIRIYRLGYYQGNGARRVAELGPFKGVDQLSPVSDTSTGLVDCGNWTESASWTAPITAVSGVYIAKLIREGGGSSHITFVVRDDQRNAGLLFKTSDATWQAYNVYGGNSLYVGSTTYPNGHAVKVSYNRPFVTRGGGGGGGPMEDFLFNAEYPMIRWLERNGFDMVYSTDLDMERDPTPITPSRYKALLSVGHDEYWSAAQRAKVEAARDAGVHLAFFSGNEVYWKTRWENSIDGNNTPHRTLVCYKEGDQGENVCGDKCDPLPNVWTGLWRSGCSFAADGCKPENALTGQISWTESTGSILVSDVYKNHPIWRNTSIATLDAGQSVTLPVGTLGYEWDAVEPSHESSYPAGREVLSRTTLDGKVHELSMYRHPSGAIVFGAGTIQWSWGLDNVHDRGNEAPSRDMQQATVNLFSDMGVQPASLQTDLVPGIPQNDTIPPVSVIVSPAHDVQLSSGSFVTISGTASDSGGGIVSRVEISTDGGATWQLGAGTTNWSYQWALVDTGVISIKVRAVDNSGNVENEGNVPSNNAISIRVQESQSFSIWSSTDRPVRDTDPDRVPIEVGVKFKPRVDGYITGIRYYKSVSNTGPHVGNLWTSTGQNLGRATFMNESATGWQEVLFATPVPVIAGTTYLASYHTTAGAYASDEFFFSNSGVTTPFLEALQDNSDGPNGVYEYSASSIFPANGYNATNFWVDVVFSRNLRPDTTPPTISTHNPTQEATQVSPLTSVTITFSEPLDTLTINNSTVALLDSAGMSVPANILYDPSTYRVTVKPLNKLADATRYSVKMYGGVSGAVIKDRAGNSLAADYIWSFTTGTAPNENGPFSIWSPTETPRRDTDPDQQPVEVGVKFRPLVDGYITGIRYYKSLTNTGVHTGNLWSRTGVNLARATFSDESSSGWQEVLFDTPVEVTAGTVYIASYHTTTGQYASDYPFFTQAVTTPYLEALRDGEDGPNGLYQYTSTTAFPTNGYEASNFWVDVVFRMNLGPDSLPPTVVSTTPLRNATGVPVNSQIKVTFSESIERASISSATVELRDSENNLLNTAISYSAGSRTVDIAPEEQLNFNSAYTVVVKGSESGVKDRSGNALQQDYTWTFTTSAPPPPPPAEGPGGPILVVSSAVNPFSRYPVEILRAEGLNSFTAMDISTVSSSVLSNYDVAILGEVSLTSSQVSMFTDWTQAGGTFIAFRPDAKLSSLLGLTRSSGTLSDRYLAVNTSTGPGVGIVSETIQFHGAADLYTLNGATALATLFSSATAATSNPAVTLNQVGTNGGQAVAFTYDLARSIVYTRQGNPAWAGQERDGQNGPIRANDMFFGNSSSDPKPDWIDFEKIEIPQADEQQRLLANIIIQGNMHRKPLPRFWYLPKGLKAAIVMTGDDHATGGTAGRFEQYKSLSSSNTPEAVADWTAIRGTSYIFPNSPLTPAQLSQYQAEGFEVALHLNTGCVGYSESSLNGEWASQGNALLSDYPGINPFVTNRTHCMPWSDWATQAKVQASRGVRLDVNYYYWPGGWIQNRPGMFTGSGIPMRFADLDGTIIDCYQVPTQITDESEIDNYTAFISSLLDKAKGPEGYYGVFCANMHTDEPTSQGSDEIISSAMARQIPVVSAKQMLDWLDGRNNSSFGSIAWNQNQLSFSIAAASGSRNMKGMLPATAATGKLTSLALNGSMVPMTWETIKGIEYAFFDAAPGDYVATYGINCLAVIPENTTIQAFSDAKFTTRSSMNNVTYQWQVSTDQGNSFSNISNDTVYSGANDTTLTIARVSRAFNNFQYRCVITGECSATTTPAALTVNKASQTITWVTPPPITYGTAVTSAHLNASVAGVEGGSAPGALSYSVSLGAILPAGNQALTVIAEATKDYNEATATTLLAINPRPVSAQVVVSNKNYDATTTAAISSRALVGILQNDNVTLVGGVATFGNRHAGRDKPVTVTGLSIAGASAGNYLLTSEFVTTTADIDPKTIQADITVASKAYSGTASATILSREITGAYPIDTLYIWGGVASFDGPGVGNGKTVTVTGIRLGGINTGNYLLASSTAITSANITPKSVSGSMTVTNKVYDGTDEAEIQTLKVNGVLTADLAKVQLTGGSARFINSHAGIKRVLASDFNLSGEASGNYVLATSSFTAMGTILKRPVTVTARSGQNKLGGSADPTFLYDVTSGSLVDGDSFMGALSRVSGEAAGSYPILQGSLALGSNYQLSFQGANFIITDPIVSTINIEKSPVASQVTPALSVDQKVYLTGYPNPFSRNATVEFTVPKDEPQVLLGLYDLRGMKIAELYNGKATANHLHRFNLDGTRFPPGAYFVRLTLRNQIESFKIIMLE